MRGGGQSLNSDNMTLTIYYFSLSKREQEDIEMIFEIARIHLKNILEHNRIVRSTFFDNLTGAYTRQVGMEVIGKIFESIKRGQRKGYLVFIDIDDLKKYNDKCGHQKGDELLKNISQVILSNIRKNDILVRYGGDEFILYIDSSSPENVIKRISQMSEVKFSYGMVNLEEFTTLQEAIQSADMKMYEFKNSSKLAIKYYTNT